MEGLKTKRVVSRLGEHVEVGWVFLPSKESRKSEPGGPSLEHLEKHQCRAPGWCSRLCV